MARVLGLEDESFDGVLEWTLALRRRLELPHTLEGVVAPAQIPELVRMASVDPSLETNPKPCSPDEIERVLRKSLAGDLTP